MAPRWVSMETFVLLFAVYAVWQESGGLPLQPPARAVVSGIAIVLTIVIVLLGAGMVHLH